MKNVVGIIFLMVCTQMFSQLNDNLIRGGRERVLINQNSEIKGENFLFEEWNQGVLFLTEGGELSLDFIQYNIFSDELYVKQEDETVVELYKNFVKGFTLINREISVKHDFINLKKSKFSSEVNDGYFEVIENKENTKYLIKKVYKIIYDPNKSKGTQAINNIPKEYKDKKSYFIMAENGLYQPLKLNKKSLKKVLYKNSKQIDTYIKENSIKFSNEKSVIKLINYYYTLLKE